jgi:hypothetical protein
MRILLATCTVYTWLIGRVSTVTGTVDTRPIVEFFVVMFDPPVEKYADQMVSLTKKLLNLYKNYIEIVNITYPKYKKRDCPYIIRTSSYYFQYLSILFSFFCVFSTDTTKQRRTTTYGLIPRPFLL